MNELVNIVKQKTGLSDEQAQKVVTVVVDFIKSRLPAGLGSHLDAFTGEGNQQAAGNEQQQTGGGLLGEAEGLLGRFGGGK